MRRIHDPSPPVSGMRTGPTEPGGPPSGAVLEIACDESGSEGEKLIGGSTDVFAHASVDLDADAATGCIERVRIGARSPALECKAGVVLRARNRRLLEWLIGPTGPLLGHAHVHLTEKTFLLVSKVVEVLRGDATGPAGPVAHAQRGVSMAITLHREAPAAFGREPWLRLLGSFNDLLRARNLADAWTSAHEFFDLVDLLCHSGAPGGLGGIMGELGEARPRAAPDLARLLDKSRESTVLDPLVPAIAGAVAYWGQRGRPVSVVHDEQDGLTAERIARLEELCCAQRATNQHARTPGGLAGVRLVDSRSDPRVQVADFLAGVARKIASDELNGRGEPHLSTLLRPYVDLRSVWADERSWARLASATCR